MATPQKVTKQFILDHLDEFELDLSLCYLTDVPVKELVSVQRFRKLDLSQNKISLLPDSFAELRFVTSIDLSKNQLTCLPENIGELTQLQKLDLFGNELSTLPLGFSDLRNLKWLDVRANQLEPKLVAVAGDCSSEKECKDCALNIVRHMQEAKVTMEKEQKKKAERKKARDKKKEKKRQHAEADSKKQKEENKVRRRQAWQEKQEAEMVENSGIKTSSNRQGNTTDSAQVNSKSRSFESTLLRVLLILLIVLVGLFVSIVILFWDSISQSLTLTGLSSY